MCCWNSGFFYYYFVLVNMQYYWCVEFKVYFFCDVDYDVFCYMQDNNKIYGFIINFYDFFDLIFILWFEILKFIVEYFEYVYENNVMDWLMDKVCWLDYNKKVNGYLICYFWLNFEIVDMSFWRSKVYEDYFNYLDWIGNFFYERWGDVLVYSIGLGLFEDKSRIYWYVVILMIFVGYMLMSD